MGALIIDQQRTCSNGYAVGLTIYPTLYPGPWQRRQRPFAFVFAFVLVTTNFLFLSVEEIS